VSIDRHSNFERFDLSERPDDRLRARGGRLDHRLDSWGTWRPYSRAHAWGSACER